MPVHGRECDIFPLDLCSLGNNRMGCRRSRDNGDVAAECDIRTFLPCGRTCETDDMFRAACADLGCFLRRDGGVLSDEDGGTVVHRGNIAPRRTRELFQLLLRRLARLARELCRGLEGHVVRRIGERLHVLGYSQRAQEDLFDLRRQSCVVFPCLGDELLHLMYRLGKFFRRCKSFLRYDVAGIVFAGIAICFRLIVDICYGLGRKSFAHAECFQFRAAFQQFVGHLLHVRIAEMGICRDLDVLSRNRRRLGGATLL